MLRWKYVGREIGLRPALGLLMVLDQLGKLDRTAMASPDGGPADCYSPSRQTATPVTADCYARPANSYACSADRHARRADGYACHRQRRRPWSTKQPRLSHRQPRQPAFQRTSWDPGGRCRPGDFMLAAATGSGRSLESYRGDKNVVVVFYRAFW